MKSTLSWRIGRSLIVATLFGAMVILASTGAAYAGVITISPTATTDTFKTEPGQSIPTGVGGYVDGTLNVTAGEYTFIYGGNGLMAGDTGFGNATSVNEFSLAGHVFCNHSGDAACGGVATTVGTSFTITLSAGAVPFTFVFGGNSLANGNTSTQGAYLAQIGTGASAFAGPGLVGYLGLSDGPYPASDTDFQDLVVTVQAAPEPSTLLLMGGGLLAAGLLRRYRKN